MPPTFGAGPVVHLCLQFLLLKLRVRQIEIKVRVEFQGGRGNACHHELALSAAPASAGP